MIKSNTWFVLLALFFVLGLKAQVPQKPNASEIYHEIEKLNFLGTVLYVAAHPDDENTRMIAYFANEQHARTAYLSLTRGDGGQNLIGPEIREQLGVIRTNELLQARRLDGGEQFFTRANDFGYSKHPDETLRIWDKDLVLNDVVKIIRQFKPDIIINRFNAESAGRTHGHHTTSAMLSLEAFDLSSDSNYKTEGAAPWEVQRIFFNTHWWFYGSREKFNEVDKSDMLWVDTGVYYPQSGLSNSEIASLSRSMHKSQGFGSTGTRGTEKEYLQLLKGKMPADPSNLFEGVDTSWNRVEGGQAIGQAVEKVLKDYDFNRPWKSVPELMSVYAQIQKLEDSHWKTMKSKEVLDIVAACSGLFLEGVAEVPYGTQGEEIALRLEAVNRSPVSMKLAGITYLPSGKLETKAQELKNNEVLRMQDTLKLSDQLALTAPYWLDAPWSNGMYTVDDPTKIGHPITDPELKIAFSLDIEGVEVELIRNVVFKKNDPVRGEVYQPFEITPSWAVNIDSKVILFNDEVAKSVPVRVKSMGVNQKGRLELKLPNGWKAEPAFFDVQLKEKDEEQTFVFSVTPTKTQSEGYLEPMLKTDQGVYTKSLVSIDYDHIPKQMLFLPAKVKVVRLDLQKNGKLIGYIEGAGDEVPKYLRQAGFQVEELEVQNISAARLKKYDAVITGIRAYNTVEALVTKQAELLRYVEQGGNLIVQYNTSHRLKVKKNLAPYSLELSRKRITDENAPVTFLQADHELLSYPNKLSKSDFDGWVQERGLYFPEKWDEQFDALLSFQENGEEPLNGSLLIAKYGEGHYIYTGLSFFRELPAGVPGAYKLMSNMISVGKNGLEDNVKN